MAKAPVIIANVIGQSAAMFISPFVNGTSVKEAYFEGYRKIEDIFPDRVLSAFIADLLGKKVEEKILCEALYPLRSLVYRAEKRPQVRNFAGVEYLGGLETLRITHCEDLQEVPRLLQRLPSLRAIEFSHGTLRSIPEWIFKMPRLEKLNFSGQNLTYLPPSVSKAKRLRALQLSDNSIETLPEELGQLKHLQALNVSGNPVTKLPKNIIYLTKLSQLDISKTQISHLPINLAFLETLTYLNITNTPIKKLDFFLQRRVQDNLKIEGDHRKMEITTYAKREYEDDRKLFPGTMLTATLFSFLAVGAGVQYLKKKKTKEGNMKQ